MGVVLKQFNNSEVNPLDDARKDDLIFNDSGIVSGCAVTHLGSNQLQVSDGWGIVKGRIFVVSQETVNAVVSDSGTKKGRLILKIDMTNPTTPAILDTQMAAALPVLVQEDINAGGDDYELPLAEYDIDPTVISNLESVANIIGMVGIPDGAIDKTQFNANTRAMIASLQGGTEIPDYANINTYIDFGTYICSTTVRAQTLTNSPFNYAFKLFVDVVLGAGTYLVQIARAINGAEKRRFTYDEGSTWSDWATSGLVKYDTSGTPPAGTYPAGTVYLQHEA